MNIYLKVEILTREIEGRLLLGLAAAERGHRVLMGDLKALLGHRLWLPPGIYHDNSLTPSSKKLALHARLRDAGFLVTSQDEEHGLLDEFGTWEDFAARRFSAGSVAGAARCFMWGPHDHATLSRLHPTSAPHIVQTGSPRVDLWRPQLDRFYESRELPGIDASRPFILFAHQSAIILDRNPFWQRIADQRPRYFVGDDDDRERGWYRRCVGEMRYLEHLMPAIRAVARANPAVQVVIRPHPLDSDGSWEALVGEIPNIVVEPRGTASGWIRRAAAIIHNGSTIGFEAAAAARPLIAFQPTTDRAAFVSNRLGRSAASTEELLGLVRHAVDGTAPAGGWHPPGGPLTERLGSLDGPLAADRIVDEWETVGRDLLEGSSLHAARARRVADAHRVVGRLRTRLRTRDGQDGFLTDHKFSAIRIDEVRRLADDLRRTLGRFDDVDVRSRGPRLIELRHAGTDRSH